MPHNIRRYLLGRDFHQSRHRALVVCFPLSTRQKTHCFFQDLIGFAQFIILTF
jgi:hypothetical protein